MTTSIPALDSQLIRLLRADFYRLIRSKWLWLSVAAMLALSVAFVSMQYSGMDYVVALDRVVFLPLSFYGVIAAAFISLFIGEDFNDGCIRNKVIAGKKRSAVFLSGLIVSCVSCVVIYLVMLAVTISLGLVLFENNVLPGQLISMIALGFGLCLVYSCIYCVMTFLIGNRTTAVVVCMILSFCMLFLALHTNQVVIQQPMKDGLPNPHYVSGLTRVVYECLHDFNPTGQASQLSQMDCHSPVGWILWDIIWLIGSIGSGIFLFGKKNIR